MIYKQRVQLYLNTQTHEISDIMRFGNNYNHIVPIPKATEWVVIKDKLNNYSLISDTGLEINNIDRTINWFKKGNNNE